MLKKVSLMALIACASMSLTAQQKITLSLQDAKNQALAHNRALQNASLDVKKAHAARWQTIATMLPQVSAGYDYQNTMGYTMVLNIPTGQTDPTTGEEIIQRIERKNPPQGTFNITVGAQISGQQIVGAMVHNIAVEIADIAKKQTEQNTINNTTQLYMSALAVQKIVTLLDESKANVDKIFQSTQNAVDVGAVEQTEADKLSVQVMKIESAITTAKQSSELAINALKIHLGLNVDTEIELSESIDNLTNAETALELLHTDFNINDNYNYQLLKQNLKLSKRQITLAGMGYSPTLQIGYRFSDVQYFGGTPMMAANPPNAISIGVSIPLFTSGRVFENIAEKKIDYAKTKNTFDDTENQLKIQNKQLRFNLNSAYENFQIQKRNIDVTNRVFNNVSEKFRYGKSSSLEVTQASTDFISAQNSYIQALLDMVNAQVALRNLLNK